MPGLPRLRDARALPACSTAAWWKPRAPRSKHSVAARLARARHAALRLRQPAAIARLLTAAGALLYLYRGQPAARRWCARSGFWKLLGKLGDLEQLAPPAEPPFFFSQIGKTFPAEGERRYRVAFLAGCIANISFARLNEATVRVLQKNGCEVVVPRARAAAARCTCTPGMREEARKLARRNIDAVLDGGFDAIITNAAGCGSTLKEYDELLEHDPGVRGEGARLRGLMKDVTEFLASIELNRDMGRVPITVTYQDSCHLAHGQKVRTAPRQLLAAVPGLQFREMPLSDLCCGSAGIYNVVQNEMAMQILEKKMKHVNPTGAEVIATANPGCMLQLQAGVRLHGKGQRVVHVVEILDRTAATVRSGSEQPHSPATLKSGWSTASGSGTPAGSPDPCTAAGTASSKCRAAPAVPGACRTRAAGLCASPECGRRAEWWTAGAR